MKTRLHHFVEMMLRVLSFFVLFLICFQNQVFASETKPNEPGPWPSLQVNTYTGNLFHLRSDLLIPTRGEIPLEILFSYNSLKYQHDKGYGNGWSLNFGMYYKPVGNDMIIFREEGEEDVFTWDGSAFVPPSGVYDVLTEYEPGKYLLTTKYGLKYYFESSIHKRLTKITDRNGNTTTISYTDGKPTAITDPAGRLLNLSWVNSHLSQITDPNTTPGRVIDFQYDGSWNMIQVTRPLSNIYLYGYDSSGKMIFVTDPLSNTVSVSYDVNEAVAGINCPPVNYHKTFIYDNCNNTTTVSQVVTSIIRQTVYTFDLNGRVIAKQFPDGNGVSYSWDSQENMITYTDENGNMTFFAWDPKGNMLSKTDCLSNSEQFTYESTFNKVASYLNKNGNPTFYYYDGFGNLTSIADCIPNSEFYTYDAYGNMLTSTDKNGFTTDYTYNIHGYLTGLTDPFEYVESYTYDQVGNMLTSNDKRGFATVFSYDLLNRHTGTLDALGYTSSYSYDGNGNLVSETNQNSKTTTYSYDPLNRLIGKTDALGGITSYTYNEAGNKISETNENGFTTAYTYNSRNWLIKNTNCLGYSESYSYNNAGNMLTSMDKAGNTTNYQYDCLGRLTVVTDPNGYIESYSYDPVGNKISSVNKKGIPTNYFYDCLNRLINTNYALGYSESYAYDAEDQRTTVTNKNGFTTSYTYDALGRVLQVTDPLAKTELYTYDEAGNIASFTNKKGFTTTYTYDNIGRLISKTDPLPFGYSESYTYDGVGNRLTVADRRGYTTTFTYDDLNRPLSTVDPLGYTESYTYDAMGNQLTFTNKNGNVTSYSYDCQSQQTSTTDPMGYSEYYAYNAVGNMTSLTGKNGGITAWNYSCCRLLSMTDPLMYSESYGYDQVGNKTSLTNKNGMVSNYIYDNLDRLTTITTPLGNQTLYSRDGMGNELTRTDANLNTTTYTYNARGELITTLYPDATTISYSYDNNGNITQTTNTGGTGNVITYNYDALDRLISKQTNFGLFSKTITYGYDQNGNNTNIISPAGTISYQYDANNRVIQNTDQNLQITTYQYDAAGNQTAVHYPNGVSTFTTYDAMGNVLSVMTADTPPPPPLPPPDSPGVKKAKVVTDIPGQILFETDYACETIIAPVSGPGLSEAEPVIISILNLGAMVLPQIEVSYSIDGGMPVSETIPIPIPPMMPFSYVFMQTADLSIPGHTYELTACVMAMGDENPMNDCMTSLITNEGSVFLTYQSFNYGYNSMGDILWEQHLDGAIINYEYNLRNDLLSEYMIPSGNLNQYTYTPTGQRASKTENGIISEYFYNDDDMLIAAGGNIYLNDNRGNRVTLTDPYGDVTHFSYGFENELRHVNLPDLTSVHYDYSALGTQLKKTENGISTYFLSVGQDNLEEYNSSEVVIARYNPGISINLEGMTGYYIYNGFESATMQMDPVKSIIATAGFDAFGMVTNSTGMWMHNTMVFNSLPLDATVNLYKKDEGVFYDLFTGSTVNSKPSEEKGKPAVSEPGENVKDVKEGGNPATEEKKVKCCGVKKFVVKWSKPSGWYVGQMLRIDVEIEFMADDEHDPACCEFCQNVKTVFKIIDGPNKGRRGDTSPMHDDHYGRGDDSDGKPGLSDPGFTTDDNPGFNPDRLKLDPNDNIEYSFTAEQMVKEKCESPCPKGTIVAQRGPHTATVKGKEPRTFTGVPTTLDK